MCPNATSAGQIPRYSYDAQAYYLPYRLKREVGSVTVEITLQKPKPSLPQPLDYLPSEALSLREAMIRDRQAAMQRRDMRAVHEIEADLRAVTLAMTGRGR